MTNRVIVSLFYWKDMTMKKFPRFWKFRTSFRGPAIRGTPEIARLLKESSFKMHLAPINHVWPEKYNITDHKSEFDAPEPSSGHFQRLETGWPASPSLFNPGSNRSMMLKIAPAWPGDDTVSVFAIIDLAQLAWNQDAFHSWKHRVQNYARNLGKHSVLRQYDHCAIRKPA